MPRTALTNARIRALGPRKATYDIRDGKLTGFGLRVLPSGRKRFFVHCQHDRERVWKIVGDAAAMDVREARSRAARILAAIRRGGDVPPGTLRPDEMASQPPVDHRHDQVVGLKSCFLPSRSSQRTRRDFPHPYIS